MPSKQDVKRTREMILEYIVDEVNKKGYPPTVRSICEAVGLKSTSSVQSHLNYLRDNGYLTSDPTKPRTLNVANTASITSLRKVPIVGRVAAGEPILAIENIEDMAYLPEGMFPKDDELFILEVKGLSMIKVGIMDKDKIVVAKRDTAENGDIVVALLDDSATVKRFYKENGHYRLQPENDAMEPIIVNEVTILGKVVGLYRRM